MTLQEAINSGKPFIRKSYNGTIGWITPCYDEDFEPPCIDGHGECFVFTEADGKRYDWAHEPQDILATDWVIKQTQAESILDEILKSDEKGDIMGWDELHSKIRKVKEILEKEGKDET